MAFGSDLFPENKLSSKVLIQSPQTEKLRIIWLKIMKFGVVLCCPLHEKNKNELLQRFPIDWLGSW